MYKLVKLETMEEVLAMTANQPYRENIGRHRSHYLYRGLSNADYHLQTSLQRNCGRLAGVLEPRLLENFQKYTANEATRTINTVWKQMILGQHHGLPTRMMDWTRSPMIALNFATGTSLDKLDKRDCAVWKIDVDELHAHLPEPFRDILTAKKIHTFSVEMLNSVTKTIEEYDAMTEGKSMVFIEPPSVDPRIVSQYAYFSVVPGQMTDLEAFLAEYSENTIKYVITKELKWRIRDYLDEANINERMIYPGLDGICKWLSRQYYVRGENKTPPPPSDV